MNVESNLHDALQQFGLKPTTIAKSVRKIRCRRSQNYRCLENS